MKNDRISLIKEIISKNEVSTQCQLRQLLLENGVEVTQATLSRDFKTIGVVKAVKNGKSFYRIPEASINISDVNLNEKYFNVFKQSVISVISAGCLLVIKCYTGMAQGVCAALDSMNISSIVGTIAGDDTIFAACQTQDDAMKTADDLSQLLK